MTDISDLVKINTVEAVVGSCMRTEAMIKVLLVSEAKRKARWSLRSWQWHYSKMIEEAKGITIDQYDNLPKYP